MSSAIQPSNKTLFSLYIAIPVTIVALAALFIFVGRQAPPPMLMPPQKVILSPVEERELSDTREYVALMEADNRVDLRARVSGFLISKNFQEGDPVKAGQLLFQIEPNQYQALLDNAEAAVLSAQAQFDRAQLDYSRISDLFHKNATPKSEFDRSKADYEVTLAALNSAKASRTQAQLNLTYAAIKAPFDGQISDTPYSEGSLLGLESGVLATVVQMDPILVTFGISEKMISQALNAGQGAQGLRLDDWQVRLRLGPDTYYRRPGKLVYIAPTVDLQTDTIKFKAKFGNPDHMLRPGQIVTAIVSKVKPEKRLVVPKEAVLTDVEGNYVYVPKPAPADPKIPDRQPGLVADKRRVVLEPNDPLIKEYLVKEGLSVGEQVIVKGLMSQGATLRPGAPVEVAPAEAPGGQPAAKGAKEGQSK